MPRGGRGAVGRDAAAQQNRLPREVHERPPRGAPIQSSVPAAEALRRGGSEAAPQPRPQQNHPPKVHPNPLQNPAEGQQTQQENTQGNTEGVRTSETLYRKKPR